MTTIRSFLAAWLLIMCLSIVPAYAGNIFITGHDPDYHAVKGTDPIAAQHIIQRAIAYVSNNKANPTILLVADRRTPEGSDQYIFSGLGLQASGFNVFDVAAAPHPANVDTLDLNTVDFSAYDVVVAASAHGGSMRQDEVDILNARKQDLTRYINTGGGLVVLNQCGPTIFRGRYEFISEFLSGDYRCDKEYERGFRLAPAGQEMGLTLNDVNGNVSHTVLPRGNGLDIVDFHLDGEEDLEPEIISLAARMPNILDCVPAINLQCPGPLTLTSRITEAEGKALRVVWSVDNVAVQSTDVPAGGPPTAYTATLTRDFAPGTYAVKLAVTKAGGATVSCTTQVTVGDTTAPTISTCAANKIVPADANCQGAIPDLTAEVRAAAGDNCTPAADLTITQTPAAGTLVGLGVTSVTITVTDAAGNTKTCVARVRVKDSTPPTITTLPDNKVLRANAQCQAAIPNLVRQVVATDNCSATRKLTVTQSPAAGTLVGPGLHTVTITVTDAAGNATTATVRVRVRDVTPPTITKCANNRLLRADTTTKQATLPDLRSEVQASDNCPGDVTVTQSPAAGTQLPVGIHAITFTATDAAGNASTCTSQVGIRPTDLPPPPVGPDCKVAMPDVRSEAVPNPAPGVTLTQSPAPGTIVSVGTYTVLVTATDANGVTFTIPVAVRVVDTTPPTISKCAPDRTLTASGSGQIALPDMTGEVEVTDNCTQDVTVTQSPVAGTLLSVGIHDVIFTARDEAGNTSTCTTKVTVIDNTPPTITQCASAKSLTTNAQCQAAIPNLVVEVTATDNVTPVSGLVITQSPAAGTIVGPGAHTVTITVTDAAGNRSTCTAVVTVRDTTAPVITGQGTTKTLTANATCQAVIPDLTAEVRTKSTDNCTSASSLVITQSTAAGSLVGLGTHTVTVTVKDAAGNASTVAITITVTDTTAPSITKCAADRTLNVTSNGQVALPNLTGEVVATDNCSGAVTVTQSPAAGTLLSVGIHTVTFTARDAAGNTSTCTSKVTVVDNTPPTITNCASAKTLSTNAQCQAAIPSLVGEVTATDNGTPVSGLVITQSPAAGTLVGPGVHTVTITVADAAGNKSTCTAVVTVKDTSAPVIARCAANRTLTLGANCLVAVPDLTAEVRANTTDNCTPASALVITQSPAAGTMIGAGNTTVTITVADAAGNKATCTTVLTGRSGGIVISNASVSQTSLWPPNHRMVDVAVNYTVANCDPACAVTTRLTVSSNEADDATGDGRTTNDAVVIDNHKVSLRSERAGGGSGRTYTITIIATDCNGVSTTKTLTVAVPHSGGGLDDDGGDDRGDDDGYPGKKG